jgi:hypothetical protein
METPERKTDLIKEAFSSFATALGIINALTERPMEAVGGYARHRARRILVAAARKVGL